MLIELELMELHSTLFLGGKNFGSKLEPAKVTNLLCMYDDENRQYWVVYNGKYARLHETSVSYSHPKIVPDNVTEFFKAWMDKKTESLPKRHEGPRPLHQPKPEAFRKRSNAQVSTPAGPVEPSA